MVSTLAGNGTSAGTNGGWVDGTGAAAAFNFPRSVVMDVSGNVLVADWGNNRVRRVTPSGGTLPPSACNGGHFHLHFMFCFASAPFYLFLLRFQCMSGGRVRQLVFTLRCGIVLPRWYVESRSSF